MRRTTKTESIEDHDAEFADDDDPWQTVRRALNVISLNQYGGDVEDPNASLVDEVDAPNLSGAFPALRKEFAGLTEQERSVLLHRLLGYTYADVAKWCEPPISGPSQARKIEQRALKKMRDRLSKFRKLFAKG